MRYGTVEERVARGAALMDKHDPAWPLKIDVTRLELVSCTDCILGQVYGDFASALSEPGLRESLRDEFGLIEVSRFGFNLINSEVPRGSDICGAADELRDAWIAAIKERLDRGVPVEDLT